MAKNGETKGPSKLAVITADVDPKRADMKTVKKLIEQYQQLEGVIRDANASADEARAKQYAIAEQVVKQTGKAALTTKDGSRLVPTCRGESIFFKNQAELDSISV